MKKLTRFLACFLAAVLVVSNLQYVGVKAVEVEEINVDAEEDAATEKILTFKELGKAFGYGHTIEVDEETGAATIKFNNEGGYGEIRYNLPEGFDTSKVSNVEVLVEKQDSAVGLKLFLLKDAKGYEEDQWGGAADAMVNYDAPSKNPEWQFESLGIFSKADVNEVKVTGIKFTYGDVDNKVKEPPVQAETITQTFKFAELEKFNNAEGELTYAEDKETGKTTVTYGGQYKSLFVKIPESVDVANLKEVQFTNDNAGDIGYKLYTNSDFATDKHNSDAAVSYGNPVIKASAITAGKNKADLGWVVVMSMANKTYDVVFESVTFITNVPQPKTNEYVAADLVNTPDNGVVVTEEDGKLVIEYPAKWNSVYFGLPRNVNGMTLNSVSFDVESVEMVSENSVSENSVGNLAFKVLTDEQQADPANKQPLAVGWGNPEVKVPATTDPVTYVAVMSNDGTQTADQKLRVVLKGFSFTFMPQGDEDRYIEDTVPSLYKVVEEESNISMGVAVPAGALTDVERMKLVYKHYNSVSCENEMKPDGILGGAPKDVNEDGKVTVEDIQLNFSNPDKMMDAIVSENSTRKEGDKIGVRGHVFVWHSQTPTWFFREGFAENGAYVTPEVMNTRMEWYIKSVAQHFDDKYPNLIYAWDVVNEAANDAGGPRQNGDWFNVYGKEDKNNIEYIIKAFEYADNYLDPDTILFYNDYNECTPTKRDTIVGYLKAIKEKSNLQEGRKLGAGMQGHHDMATPTIEMIEAAVRAYGKAADVVHVTELDVKSTMGYVDSPEARVVEYTQQGHRYKEIYNMIKRVNEDPEITGKVENITIWGTDDRNSWLKTSNSVGGSADGKTPQFPLLFDEDLKVKPAYWAFVDQSKLEPAINAVNAMNTDDPNYASENVAKKEDGTAWFKFKTYWADGKLYFWVDDTVAKEDVKLYTDIDGDDKVEGPVSFVNGVASVDVKDISVKKTYLFDIVVGENAYNDTKGTYAETSKYYAKVTTKPLMKLAKGTAFVDGDTSDWKDIEVVEFTEFSEKPEATVETKVCWDEENLYVLMDVKDENLDATAGADHEKDSMEVFIDELNEKAGGYDANDKQYRVNYRNEQTFNGSVCGSDYIESAVKVSSGKDSGYVIEAAIKWTALKAEPGELIGLDLQINDAKGGKRIGTRNWYDTSGNGWQNPGVFGTAVLVDAPETTEADEAKAKAADDAAKAIGSVAYTTACAEKIDAAVAAYADMTVVQRLLVAKTTFATIKAAKAEYDELHKEVRIAEEMIAMIGDVAYTESSLKAIEAAKEACKGLNDDQKAAMKSALDKLAEAEKAYEAAKAEYLANEENKKNDAAAVKKVTDLIKAIGTVTYDPTAKAKIDEARKAYDALTQAQKDQIPADVLKALTDAETTYKAAEEEATKVEYFAKFSAKSVPLKKGQSSTALAKDIQIAKGDKIVKWTTSKSKIVSVNKKTGKIKGKKVGTATITAYTESGLKASIKVVVQKKKVTATKITLTNKATKKAIKAKSTVTLKKGKKMTVVANVKPMTSTEKVKFTSSNKKVVSVTSKGVIKAKKKGTATITAKVGKKTFKFKVKVK